MEFKSVLSRNYFVSWHETDFQSRMTIKSICDNLMEVAWQHAGDLGFGFEDLDAQEYAWVISSLLIEINEYPTWRDQIKSYTWPVDVDGVFATRHFKILDKDDRRIVNAGSKWLIIHKKSRRPVRPEKIFGDQTGWVSDRSVGAIGKINFESSLNLVHKHEVKYADIDFNGHMINSKYTELILNSIPMELFSNCFINSFQINFLKETRYGDVLQVFADKSFEYFKITNSRDQKEVVHVQIGWK